jgi:hypothetical protein
MDNITIYLGDKGWCGVDFTGQVQDRDNWKVIVNVVDSSGSINYLVSGRQKTEAGRMLLGRKCCILHDTWNDERKAKRADRHWGQCRDLFGVSLKNY